MIAILSDSPTLTTGFGRTTEHIARALHDSGREVACFGIKARPEDVNEDLPYLVWPAEQGDHWTKTLPEFFAATTPDCLLVNMDAYNAVEVITAARTAGYVGPVVSYVVFDGLPVGLHYLDIQRTCDAVIASSQTAATYLRSEGLNVAGIAPPGVDTEVFRADPDRDALRARAGLADVRVIGVFGVNTERKQTARVLAALPSIHRDLASTKTVLYLHCRPVGFWRLADMAHDLGVADQVLFPATSTFDEWRGVPTNSRREDRQPVSDGRTPHVPSDLSYVERLNLCDVIVNVPHSGDIEQVILEAQACGVPLVHTDDQGVMAEAVGAGGFLLPAVDTGIGRAGEQIQHVATADIASAVSGLLRDDAAAAELRRAGLLNATKYPWTVLETEMCKVVSTVLGD